MARTVSSRQWAGKTKGNRSSRITDHFESFSASEQAQFPAFCLLPSAFCLLLTFLLFNVGERLIGFRSLWGAIQQHCDFFQPVQSGSWQDANCLRLGG